MLKTHLRRKWFLWKPESRCVLPAASWPYFSMRRCLIACRNGIGLLHGHMRAVAYERPRDFDRLGWGCRNKINNQWRHKKGEAVTSHWGRRGGAGGSAREWKIKNKTLMFFMPELLIGRGGRLTLSPFQHDEGERPLLVCSSLCNLHWEVANVDWRLEKLRGAHCFPDYATWRGESLLPSFPDGPQQYQAAALVNFKGLPTSDLEQNYLLEEGGKFKTAQAAIYKHANINTKRKCWLHTITMAKGKACFQVQQLEEMIISAKENP